MTSALVLVLALLSPASLAATPRQAAGPCTGTSGVTVVVDFQELGGGVNVVCASGPVSSGLDALTRAGISYRTAQRFPGFVCRIADKPASDPCVNPSPPSAYWAYWIAAPGGTWCYATLGAGSRQPPPGTFEGWSFSLDKVAAKIPPPRFTPPAATTSPAPTLDRSDCTSTPQPPIATTATTAAPTAPPTTALAHDCRDLHCCDGRDLDDRSHDHDGGHHDVRADDNRFTDHPSFHDCRRLGGRWW